MRKILLFTIVGALILLLAGFFSYRKVQDHRRQHPPLKVDTYTMGEGDTLSSSLKSTTLTEPENGAVIKALTGVFDLRKCRVGDTYEIAVLKDTGTFVQFVYHAGPTVSYAVMKDSQGNYAATRAEAILEKKISTLTGTIKNNLYEAMTSSGESPELVMSYADIFGYEIDFLTDPRVGDTFTVVYEKLYSNNKFVKNGQILAAYYLNSGKEHRAIYFEDPAGHKDFYGLDGKSLRKAFLRSPLNYRRISSYFTLRRWHPILKIYRPHLGIDYAAPAGTPISSIGDGTVIFAGWEGGFGRFIKIRHPNGYTSTYGHLSGYAKGIRAGTRVNRGQVIGYCGMSGLATGPHLDFRIERNNQFINFLALSLPEASSVPANYRNLFEQVKKERQQLLNSPPPAPAAAPSPPAS